MLTVLAAHLTRRFLLPAVAAVLGALIAAIPWLVATLDHDQIHALEARLAGEARHAGTVLPWDQGPTLDAVAFALADQLGARVTVIAPDGTVLGESSRPSNRTSFTMPFTQQKLSSCTLWRCHAFTTPGYVVVM
jgi:hypothetical protein